MTKPIERAKRPPLASVREAPFKLVRDTTVDGEPNDGFTLDGYGAVFNSFTVIDSWEGCFRETIAPGSMRKSFRDNPPRIQYDHGRHPLIGSIPIASLRSISEDTDPVLAPDGGAHVVGRIYDNWLMQPVRDAIASDPPGINGMSFRFEVVRESWTYADGKPIKDDEALMVELRRTWDGSVPDDELPIRTLKELRVPEIGPVMWPAYEATSVGVRNNIIDLARLDEPGQRKLLARAVFMADNAAGDLNEPTRDDDSDDDPAALAGALDATLDQAADLIEGLDLSTLPPDVAQALNLLVAAETIADELLEAMGIDDPDDDDTAGETDSAAPGGTVRKDVDTPQPTTARQLAAAGAVAGEHLSREMKDAPQTTGILPAGEHPSKPPPPQYSRPLGRRGIDLAARSLRDMLQDIQNREDKNA